jgi:hypothetical protein
VPPGSVNSLIGSLGNWIMTTGFTALAENLAIMVAMTSAQQLLEVWQQGAEDYLNEEPAQSTGLGLLINYMLNPAVSYVTQWTTFADYVQQASPDVATQQMLISSIMMTPDSAAESASNAFNWPSGQSASSLVAQMAAYNTATTMYQAYLVLANFTVSGASAPASLPMLQACGVAQQYLDQFPS